MKTRRQVDQAALTAHFERRAAAKMTEIDDPAPVVARRPDSYIAPPPPPATLRTLPTQDAVQQVEVMPAATVQTVVRTSQVDHSKGFLLRVTPLAAAFAITAGVLTVAVFETPVLSVKTLAVTFIVFSAVFLYAFRKDLDASPAGIALRHTIGLWRHVDEERRFRHRWYERQYQDMRKDGNR